MDIDYILRVLSTEQKNVEYLNLLTEAALDTNSDRSIRTAAVHYLNDEKLLEKIAKEADDDLVKSDAIKKVGDLNFLAKIFKNVSIHDQIEILNKLNKCKDFEDFMKEVSLNPRNAEEVKTQAILGIFDDDFLFENFLASRFISVEMAQTATLNIQNVEMLRAIARSDENCRVRLAALRRLEPCDDILKDISLFDVEPHIRKIAISKCESFTPCELISRYNSVEDLTEKLEYLKKMSCDSCQDFLIFIAKSHTNRLFREEAVKKIFTSDVLKEVILKDPDTSVRVLALKNLTDDSKNQSFFESLLKDSDEQIRIIATSKITSIETLEQIIDENPNSAIAEMSVKRLKGYDNSLGRIVKKYGKDSSHIVTIALKMIQEPDILEALRHSKEINWKLRAYIVTSRYEN